jgi:hypothetical protein
LMLCNIPEECRSHKISFFALIYTTLTNPTTHRK